jgi:transposase-like protein
LTVEPFPIVHGAETSGRVSARVRFSPDVIVVAIRWYLRSNLSYRDTEELLLERGVEVDHVTIFR